MRWQRKAWWCSDLRCSTLLPVSGCGGCDVTDGRGGVWTVASGRSAGLRSDRGGWHIADKTRAPLHFDVGVPLSGHVEDAEAVIVEPSQLSLEHGCTSLASTNAHCCLAVEDGQLAAYADTHKHPQPNTHRKKVDRRTQIQPHAHTHTFQWSHTCVHTHKVSVTQSTTPKPWWEDGIDYAWQSKIEAVENRGEGWGWER